MIRLTTATLLAVAAPVQAQDLVEFWGNQQGRALVLDADDVDENGLGSLGRAEQRVCLNGVQPNVLLVVRAGAVGAGSDSVARASMESEETRADSWESIVDTLEATRFQVDDDPSLREARESIRSRLRDAGRSATTTDIDAVYELIGDGVRAEEAIETISPADYAPAVTLDVWAVQRQNGSNWGTALGDSRTGCHTLALIGTIGSEARVYEGSFVPTGDLEWTTEQGDR